MKCHQRYLFGRGVRGCIYLFTYSPDTSHRASDTCVVLLGHSASPLPRAAQARIGEELRAKRSPIGRWIVVQRQERGQVERQRHLGGGQHIMVRRREARIGGVATGAALDADLKLGVRHGVALSVRSGYLLG